MSIRTTLPSVRWPAILLAVILAAAAAGFAEPPTSEGLRSVNGTELWVKRLGAGEPIVVVHGGPLLEHGYLLPYLEPLADDYELVFFDQRLSGRSAPEVEESTVKLATFAEDIEALRVELGLGPIHLLAHSWGGLLAMRYALDHGEHLRSLILLDSMAASAKLWREEENLLAEKVTEEDRARRQAILASEDFAAGRPAAIEKLLRLSYAAQFHDPSKADGLPLYVPEDYVARSRRFAALRPDLESFDFHVRLAGLEVPALVLYGASEPGAALGGAALHAALPNSEWVLIPDAGHFPFVEQRDAFLAAVRKFLRARRPAGEE